MRVLVIYASLDGATSEIAAAIAGELCDQGLEAEAVAARDVRELDCDAVVLGSAVSSGRWRRETRPVLHDFADELESMPFWVFSAGPLGARPAEGDRWLGPQQTIAEAVRLDARDHVMFCGDAGEHEDQIRSWARTIAAELEVLPAH